MSIQGVFVTEHYWPGLADELVVPQSQRLAQVPDWLATIVLPGQQTAFGLFLASGPESVQQAVASVALTASQVSPGWLLMPATRALLA